MPRCHSTAGRHLQESKGVTPDWGHGWARLLPAQSWPEERTLRLALKVLSIPFLFLVEDNAWAMS